MKSNGVPTTPQEIASNRIQTRWLLGLALLVAFVGILNAMLMSVTERFREIARRFRSIDLHRRVTCCVRLRRDASTADVADADLVALQTDLGGFRLRSEERRRGDRGARQGGGFNKIPSRGFIGGIHGIMGETALVDGNHE